MCGLFQSKTKKKKSNGEMNAEAFEEWCATDQGKKKNKKFCCWPSRSLATTAASDRSFVVVSGEPEKIVSSFHIAPDHHDMPKFSQEAIDFCKRIAEEYITRNFTGDQMEYVEGQDSSVILDDIIEEPMLPRIQLDLYLLRVAKYINIFYDEQDWGMNSIGIISIACASVYIGRFPENLVNRNYLGLMFFVGAYSSLKYREDNLPSNSYCAKVAGVSPKDLNLMVTSFCFSLQFQLRVEETVLEQVLHLPTTTKRQELDLQVV